MTRLSIDTLRGKQSVRVTFKLAPQVIDLLSVMAAQLGIKQKTLFDQLIEQQELLNALGQSCVHDDTGADRRRQKTFVVSQESLEILNVLAEQYQAPRNVLVEMSIRRLLPILALEQEKHEKRKTLLHKVARQLGEARALLQQAEELVGADDPACQEIANAKQGWQDAYGKIVTIIERGKGMENFKSSNDE